MGRKKLDKCSLYVLTCLHVNCAGIGRMRVQTLFFDMNSYFASVAQNEEPALIGRPVGVLTTDAPGAACIAASIEAKRRGVRMGTRQGEARQLCPEIVFRPALHDVCVRYHHAIRAAVDMVLPIDRAHSVDEFSCRLMGAQQDLQIALALARDVQRVILNRVGPAMRCSVGVAPTVLLAKIAAELQKPAGVNWLHPDILPDRIAHLSLSDIPGVSRGMLPRLQRAGVGDVRALYALSPKQARAIWGNVNGERMLRELHGETVVWPRRSGQSIGHGQVLNGPNQSPEGARLVARRLLVKAAARLRREGKLTRMLYVNMRGMQGGRVSRGGAFPATQDTFRLLRLFEAHWASLPVLQPRSVSVMLTGLVPVGAYTPDLFDPREAGQITQRETLCHALDRLNHKFGQDTIRFGELPRHRVPFTGAKIAFSRVPDAEDFLE